MKLLIYSHFFAPSIGGVENITRSLADGLSSRRNASGEPEFVVTVVTRTAQRDFDDRQLQFRVVRSPGLIRLWQLIRESDVVHIAGPALAPLFLAVLASKPAVVEHHNYQAICPNGRLVHWPDRSVCPGHFQARRYTQCLRCQANEISWFKSFVSLLLMFPRHALTWAASRNIAVSQHVLERHHGLPRSTVIHHGIEDCVLIHTSHPSGSSVPAAGSVTFAYVGRFVSDKGIPVLLTASQILANEGHSFQVQLIGDGPERPKIEEIIKRARIQRWVRLTGYLSGEALAQALCGLDVVVMPTIMEETAGLAAIEQMMRGRLVIASDIGGLPEVVGDAALKFIPGDPIALAARMAEVLRDPSLISVIGSKARERALRYFSRERMIADHAREYSHVLTGKA